MSVELDVQVDQKSLARAKKTLEKYQGKPLEERLRRATLQAGKLLVPAIKSAAPVRTGNLKNSVSALNPRGINGKLMSASVGPRGRLGAHRHLVIRPHRIVTPGGRDTGRRTAGNPFVDEATRPRIESVKREIYKVVNE